MDKAKIAFFDARPYDIKSFNKTNDNYNFTIKYFNNHLTIDTVALTKGYNTVCVFVNDIVSQEIVNELYKNNVKLISLRCAGYNNVDLNAVFNKIHVTRVPAYSPYAVAEHAVALMLGLNRKTHKAYYRIRDNNFNINGLLGFDMFGKTAGIIGTGKIGKIVIKILQGFGMNVIAYDHNQDKEYAKRNSFEYVELGQLYKESDIISLHCPLTSETYHMINKNSIGLMKKGIMIINTGRGQLIDTKALIEGLKNQRIGYAGLDVYEEESDYFFEDFSNSNIDDDILARLITFNNVLITSHQAFFTKEALSNIAEISLNNIKDFYSGNKIVNEICYKCDSSTCRKKTEGKCF